MAEEKKKSFAEMFKKKSEGGPDSSGSGTSILDKFGIKKKEYVSSSSSFTKKVSKSEEDSESKVDTESGGSTSPVNNVAATTSKIIAKKQATAANSFTKNVEYGRSDLVFLVRGKDRGRDAWHYVYVDKMKKAMFLAAAKSGSLDVADYGKVLFSGWGKDPPEDIVQKIKIMFNIP